MSKSFQCKILEFTTLVLGFLPQVIPLSQPVCGQKISFFASDFTVHKIKNKTITSPTHLKRGKRRGGGLSRRVKISQRLNPFKTSRTRAIKLFTAVIYSVIQYTSGTVTSILVLHFRGRLRVTPQSCHPSNIWLGWKCVTVINALAYNRGLYNKTFYGRNLQIFVISQSVCLLQAFPAQSNVCG